MLDFLVGRVEQMLATLDLSKAKDEPVRFVQSKKVPTSDGTVFELTVNNRRFLISVEECED